MYNIFFSNFELAFPLVEERMKKIIKPNMHVMIIPWAFPNELDSEKLMNDYFKKGGRRYNKYVSNLLKLGILEEQIVITDCYRMSSDQIKKMIKQTDIILLPGGNPEMLYDKVTHETECLYEIKNFKGIIIGESAGSVLQLRRYFITAKNNYYKYFAFYDGFGVLNDPFYLDVHSINNKFYLNKLQNVANEKHKNIYAIFDDGVIIYNRELKKLEKIGHVLEIRSEE